MAAANPAQQLLAELTCSVCLDYFKDPVSLDCGHHFCQVCITQCWEELSTDFHCPECRETFSQRNFKPNRQLRNIVEASRKLTLELTKEPEVGTVCEKHQRALDDFCQEDQTPICVVCHLSRNHREHTVVPIEEAAEDYKIYAEASEISDCSGVTIPSDTLSVSSHLPFSRANHPETKVSLLRLLEEQDQIQSHLESLKKEREEIVSFKLSGENKSHELLKQLETEKQKIVSQFQQLCQFLEEQEQLLLAQLEELKKEIEKGRAEYVAKLSEELSSFSSLISEMEQKCQLPAREFLQDIKGILSRCEREKFQKPEDFSSEVKWRIWESSQTNASLETIMKKFKDSLSSKPQWDKANVTLDPDTAHLDLIVSADRKSARWEDRGQALPKNPERFDTMCCVLGCEGFTSGRHYWEVEVEGGGFCAVGVARESVRRKGGISFTPEQGIWAVMCSEDQYWALTSPVQRIPFPPSRAPRRIQVYLNYEGGGVAFFDAGRRDPIVTFPPASFAGERICPFFRLGASMRLL